MISYPWALVSLLCLTATASYLCRVNFSVTGVLLMKEFGLSQMEMGRLFSAFLLGYALFQVPAGMLADIRGARRTLLLAAGGWLVLTGLQTAVFPGPADSGATAALWLLLGLRFLLGVVEAPTFPAAAQGISRWIPAGRQGRANGAVLAAIGLGSAIAPPLLSRTMIHFGWRAALWISAIPALVAGLGWMVAREPSAMASAEELQSRAPLDGRPHGVLLSRSFILLTISYTLQGYVGYIFVFWFYLYLVQERHFDLLSGAWMSSLPWILSILSIPLGGWISDRLCAGPLGLAWGRRLIPFCGLIAAGAFLAFGAHTANPYMAAVCLAASTAFVLCVEGPFWATMMEIAGGRSGRAGGVMNMGSNAGGFISPMLTPVLAARIGWEKALLAAAALSVVGGLLWLGIRVPERSEF